MKKLITLFALVICLTATAQKKDTTIQITFSLDQYKALLYTIDMYMDSKRLSKEIIEFIQKNAQILQPADKPKK